MKIIAVKDRKKYSLILKNMFLFKNTSNVVEKIINSDESLEWLSFEKGEIIYDYNNFKNSLGIILKGKVSVRKKNKDSVLINTLCEGEAFGGAVLFAGEDKFIACIKAESKCDMLFISQEDMEKLIAFSHEVSINYIKYLAKSLVFLNERLDIFSAGSAEERTLEYLRKNCHKGENGVCFTDVSSITNMAEYLSVGRATLYRILDDFELRGIIERERKRIYIKGELI